MAQVDLGKFSCSACNRQYPWKPDYAGRKVKCKCGNVLTAPTEPPKSAAAEQEDDLLGGLYDLAEQEQQAAKSQATVETGLRCPSCQTDMLVGETICPQCNFNLKTGLKERAQKATGATAATAASGRGPTSPLLAYAGVNKRSLAESAADSANAIGGDQMKELYIPAGLVILGFIATLIQFGFAGGAWRGVTYAIPAMSLSILFNLVLSFAGVIIVAKLIDLGFGAPGPAVIKLVAICLLAPALSNIVGVVIGADSTFVQHMVAALVTLPISAGLFIYLFNLDLDEAFFTSVVIYLVNHWVVMILVGLLIAGVGSGIGFGGGGGGGAPSRTAEIVRADRAAADAMDRPNATEAREWLGAHEGRLYEGETHSTSLQLVNDLYAAGAKKCVTLSASGTGYGLIVDMPTRGDARKKVLAVIQAKEAADGTPLADQTTDEGQRYHIFHFSSGPI